jgi:hypothetical protein
MASRFNPAFIHSIRFRVASSSSNPGRTLDGCSAGNSAAGAADGAATAAGRQSGIAADPHPQPLASIATSIPTMPNLIVRGVEESVVRALKKRAGEHGRSAEAEHRPSSRQRCCTHPAASWQTCWPPCRMWGATTISRANPEEKPAPF